MKQNFDVMYQKSHYKEMLLKDEIEGYSLIFDKAKLPLSGFSNKDKPLRAYEIPYSSQQIFLIRELHRRYNVRNNDISKMFKDDWDSWTQEIYNSAWGGYLEPNGLAEPHGPKYYIVLAEKLSKYLEWLKNQPLFSDNEKMGKETKIVNESLRRSVAFCVCLLYKAGKYDIERMTKTRLNKYVGDNFKNVSEQTVTNTLLGYDLSKQKDKALFKYSERTKSWNFQDDNFDYMIDTFPDDYNKALKLFDEFK